MISFDCIWNQTNKGQERCDAHVFNAKSTGLTVFLIYLPGLLREGFHVLYKYCFIRSTVCSCYTISIGLCNMFHCWSTNSSLSLPVSLSSPCSPALCFSYLIVLWQHKQEEKWRLQIFMLDSVYYTLVKRVETLAAGKHTYWSNHWKVSLFLFSTPTPKNTLTLCLCVSLSFSLSLFGVLCVFIQRSGNVC